MFNKSYISLYFTQKQILIAQLDSSKKKVKKYAAATLPSGLIRNYKVTNPKLLSEILNGIWSKLKLKQKSVAIVIPEYSTFIKILKLSNINVSEVHEALKWQLSEVLPYSLDESITDWKILKKVEKEYTVLSVSIEKSALNTYLQAFEMAELFPIIVEIPSLCISRVCPEENALIIYIGEDETIFVLSSEGKLVGSSLLEGNDREDIIGTSHRMLAHYKETKIEKILISGAGTDTSYFSEKLKITVDNFATKWSNIGEIEAQKFLIPLSSQLQEPTIPTDPFSLNLIPNELVVKYKAAKSRLQVWSMSLAVTLFVWISFLSTLASFLYINMSIAEARNQIVRASSIGPSRQSLSTQVTEINDMSKKVLEIKKRSFSVTQILNLIYSAKPDGIVIDSYKIDLERALISIVGISDNRQSLVNFRDKLELVEDFASPEIPVSSYEKEANLDFEIQINYIPALPEKKEVKSAK